MSDRDVTIIALREQVAAFVEDREWGPFHNPKDLAAAIAVEAAELMELFLWKAPAEVDQLSGEEQHRRRVTEELADVLILCLSMSNRLEIDLADSIMAKIAVNEAKYPRDLARGRADKYIRYVPDK